MISDADYQSWLRVADVKRIVLVELHHADGVEYVASRPYISASDDSLAPNRAYRDLVSSALDITERLDARALVGEISLVDDGSLTQWINRKWRGHDIVIRLGDPSWSLADFRVVANQKNSGIQSARRGQLRFGVTDRSVVFDTPITRTSIDGTEAPLILGKTIGGSALRVNNQALEYRCSELPLQGLVVRDGNGTLLTPAQTDLVNGSVTLSAYTPRALFCECTEAHDTAYKILQWVAGKYSLTLGITASDLPSYQLGLRYDGPVNGRQILNDVARSIGGFWYLNARGELVMTTLTIPQTADAELIADDIEFNGIELIRSEDPVINTVVNYQRNYSPIQEVAGSVVQNEPLVAARLSAQWINVSGSLVLPDGDIHQVYPLAEDSTTDTALVNNGDAASLLQARQLVRRVRRDVYRVDCFLMGSLLRPGMSLKIHHPRFTELTRVLSVRSSLTRDAVSLEVWL